MVAENTTVEYRVWIIGNEGAETRVAAQSLEHAREQVSVWLLQKCPPGSTVRYQIDHGGKVVGTYQITRVL